MCIPTCAAKLINNNEIKKIESSIFLELPGSSLESMIYCYTLSFDLNGLHIWFLYLFHIHILDIYN